MTDKNIAGIDLGTTFSALAILNSIGKPEIVPNTDGDRLTPSAIFFDEENPDLIRVGIEAVNSRHINADHSVRWVKRQMGNSQWHHPIDGRDWSAVELSGLILKKLKQECSVVHGGIADVVISVPAHFDEVRRKATMDAGKLAGLNVIGIVNEPVAAALYYAMLKQVTGRVLVYDLGGGTFDVTIVEFKPGDVKILCSQGDHCLGGVDFDRSIFELFEQKYKEQYSVDLVESEEERARYEDEAEDVKKTLSRRNSAKKILYGPKGSLKVEITRADLEKTIMPLIERAELLVEIALEEAELQAGDIDNVLLVGGSTRIPLVQNRLEQMFGFKPEIAVNVDECVALGAALQAGLISMRENPDSVPAGITAGLKDIVLEDVCNHSYGTICAPIDKETGRRVARNRIILKKNQALPCEAKQTFYTMTDNQSEVTVTITQGEDENPEYVNTVMTKKFDLPQGRAAGCPIEVTYSYDLNQRMHCSFKDVQSGRELKVDLDLEHDDETDEQVRDEHKQLQPFTVE